MKTRLTSFVVLLCFFASAQKREEFFDFNFKPTTTAPFYYVITQKTDSGWYRESYFVSQRTMAMKGTYKDEACKIENGLFNRYHPTRGLREQGHYANGKKEGLWLGFDEKGVMTDSLNYAAGHRTGVSLHWHANGYPRDSLNFDGQGNGVEVGWYDDGTLAHAGRWTADTLKQGRWKYYQKNGTVLATEDYSADGKKINCACYDENGLALDTSLCGEKEAAVIGGATAWRRFLEQNLQRVIEAAARVIKPGTYTIPIRFLVDKEGNVTEVKPLSSFGHGIEEAVVEVFKKAPRWTPGRQFGRPVRSYHTQPLTFMIQQQ